MDGDRSSSSDPADGVLDHATIDELGLVEDYCRGTLDAEEERRFEAHLMDCARCQEEVEVHRSFVRGMRSVAAAEAVRSAAGLGVLAWLWRRRGLLAIAVLAAVVAGTAWLQLWRENRRLELRVAELAGGDSGGGELAGPLAAVPVVLLGVVRGEDASAAIVDPGGPWSLAVDVGADGRFTSYAVTVLDADGIPRFERRELLPNVLEVIQLTFPGNFLSPGEYRLRVYGNTPGGERVELGDYPFRLE